MKLPLPAPKIETMLKTFDFRFFLNRPETLAPLVEGKYLHWDDLRHRVPPPGMTLENWWLTIKLSRFSQYRSLPLLLDKQGNPFVFGMPEPVLADLHHIDQDASGTVAMDFPHTGQQDRDTYLVRSLIEEAISSSQLEGASTTRRIAIEMFREGRKPQSVGEKMIFNNYQAMQYIREIRDKALTPSFILEIHRILTEGTLDNPEDAGKLRQEDNINILDRRYGTLLHVPPAFSEIPERLERLCRFANGSEDDSPFVHPVVRGIILHFMLAYDHPFVDGNGRTARALFYWSLAHQRYWLMEYVSISSILKKVPIRYATSYLHTESDDNDITYFIVYQLEVLRKAINALYEYLKKKADELKTTERLVQSSPVLRARLNHRQIALLTNALKHAGAIYTVEGHRRSHNVTYETARTDLLKLADIHLLSKRKSGRAFVFISPDDIRKKIENIARTETDSEVGDL